MMNKAAVCNGRSYASPSTPPLAHLDRFTVKASCCSRGVFSTGCCLNVRYLLSLLDEMSTEPQSTEKSHIAQFLTAWYGGRML